MMACDFAVAITRAEALQIAEWILENAERERLESSEREAIQGIDWENEQ